MLGALQGVSLAVTNSNASALQGTKSSRYDGSNSKFSDLQLSGAKGSYDITVTAAAAEPFLSAAISETVRMQVQGCAITELEDPATKKCVHLVTPNRRG